MNFKRKEAAIKKYGTTPLPELEPALLADSANYEPEEIKEIVQAITEQQEEQTPPEKKNSKEGTPEKPEETKVAKFKYPLYDLWSVNVSPVGKTDDDGNAKKVLFTAIKKLRSNVKLEHSAAETLNSQSHNSLRRYYESGNITNGNEETVNIK